MQKLRPNIQPARGENPEGSRHRVKRKRVRGSEGGRGTKSRLSTYTRWSLVAGAVFVLLVGGLFGLHYYMISAAEASDVAFDEQLWRDSGREAFYRNGVPKDTRLKMYRDLVARDLLFGKTKKEVEALLGPPDNYPYFKRAWRECNYWVGPKRGLNKWGAIWLGFRFDKLGRVTETAVLETGVFWN